MAQVLNPQTGLMEEVPDSFDGVAAVNAAPIPASPALAPTPVAAPNSLDVIQALNAPPPPPPAPTTPIPNSLDVVRALTAPAPAPAPTTTAPITEAPAVTQAPPVQVATPSVPKQAPVLNLGETKTSTQTARKEYAPGTIDAMRQTSADTQRLIKEQSDAELAALRARQNANQKVAEEQGRQIELQQARDATRKTLLDVEQEKLATLRDDYEKATVDPNQYWKNSSMAGNIMSLVAIGLSGLGNAQGAAASPGTAANLRNSAWDIIQGRIERDIDAQKANIDKQGRAVTSRSNELVNLRQRLGDERNAELALGAQRLDAFGKLVLNEAEKSGNPIVVARANLLANQAKEASENKIAEMTARTVQTVNERADKDVLGKVAEPRYLEASQRDKLIADENNILSLNSLRGIKAEDIGKYRAAWESFKQKAGLPMTASVAEARAKNEPAFLSFMRSNFGVPSGKELEFAEEVFPTLAQDPANFKTRVNVFLDKSLGDYDNARRSYQSEGLNLPTVNPEVQQLLNARNQDKLKAEAKRK